MDQTFFPKNVVSQTYLWNLIRFQTVSEDTFVKLFMFVEYQYQKKPR